MVGIDITTLSFGELQRLSQTARARGQSALADALASELRNRPGRIAAQDLQQPMRTTPVAVPLVPSRVRAKAKPERRARWGLAAAALIAFALAWGIALPSPDAPHVEVVSSSRVVLVETPPVSMPCAATTMLSEAAGCGGPAPLAEAFGEPETPAI